MANARLKREVRGRSTVEGLFQVADLIEQRGMFESATAYDMIRACRNVGRARAYEIVHRANVKDDVKLRDIAPERRRAIAFDVRRLAEHRARQNGHPVASEEVGPDD